MQLILDHAEYFNDRLTAFRYVERHDRQVFQTQVAATQKRSPYAFHSNSNMFLHSTPYQVGGPEEEQAESSSEPPVYSKRAESLKEEEKWEMSDEGSN